MDTICDVIVAGAGPAGSTAAAVLARHGRRVLLLDRESFPRDKACGDIVPLGCFLELEKIGFRSTNLDRYPINQLVLEGSGQIRRSFSLARQQSNGGWLGTCVVPRLVFDKALLDHAVNCGAEILTCHVRGVLTEDGRVVGVTASTNGEVFQIHAPIVIGADGATSVIARAVNGKQRHDEHWAVALRGYVDTDTELSGVVELAFMDHIQPGYAWFFPSARRRANVGIGMRSDFYKLRRQTLHELLAEYLRQPHNVQRIGQNSVQHLKAWQIPFFTFERQRSFDGALLVGDAGGFVHPITAAGIYPAVITGKCAAEAAHHALKTGDVSQAGLSYYDDLWQALLADEYRPAVTANKLTTALPHIVSAALILTTSDEETYTGGNASILRSLGKF